MPSPPTCPLNSEPEQDPEGAGLVQEHTMQAGRAAVRIPRSTEDPLTGVGVGWGWGGRSSSVRPNWEELVSHLEHCPPLLPMCTPRALAPTCLTSAHVISTERSLWRERLPVLGQR